MSVHSLSAVLKTVTQNKRRREKSRDEEGKRANELPPGAQSEEQGGKENHGQSRGVVLLDSWHRGVGERRAGREGGAQGEPGVGGRELGPLARREPRERQEILAHRRGGLSRRQPKRLWGRGGCERWCVRSAGVYGELGAREQQLYVEILCLTPWS